MALQVVGSSPQLSMAGQAYWIGTDGNVWLHNADGSATNLGKAAGTGTTANLVLNGAKEIPNPGAPVTNSSNATVAPSSPNGTAAAKVLNQGAVNNTQATIDQLPALLASALGSEDQTYTNTNNAFDASETAQNSAHDTGTVTNQQNYDANFMDSIRAGIHGLGGLMALLRGSGASGGSAEDQVNDVVGGVTANDIRNGADTQKNNQGQLDSSLATFLTDLKNKRQVNADTHENNRRAITRDNNTQLQDLYGKMAGFFGDAGMTGQSNDFMARAGALTPAIADATRTQVSNYDTTPVVVHAPNLTAFAPPSQPDVAAPPQDGQVGSGIFAMTRKKDSTTPVMAPAGA